MGEGIRAVRIVSLLKKAGDKIALDEPLCEVETDKAVYPVESAHAGVLKAWRCQVDDLLSIGDELVVIATEAAGARPETRAVVRASDLPSTTIAPSQRAPSEPNLSLQQLQHLPRAESATARIAPALSPAITRRLASVIPANIQLDAPWKNLRAAREQAKTAHPAWTPSLMLAWCLTQAMTRHAPFRRLVLKDGEIVQRDVFDLGVAVALEGDRLATAVVHEAPRLDWLEFGIAYERAVAEVRAGRIEEVQAPVNLTSLGAWGVELAQPIVVPPAMSTLFTGAAHEKMINDRGVVYPAEVVTLSLTFDHRVVNGAGAAAFLNDLRGEIERFELPAEK
jgi:pyruvate/2-oxoglutarate dehydrogenase complex dihydrolipoamide acyltransferase (E2) component